MKNRFITVVLLMVFMVTLTGNAQATSSASADQPALVYVKAGSSQEISKFASTNLPLYATIEGGLLTGADQSGQQALQAQGLSFQVLDTNLRSGTFYLAETYPSRQAPDFSAFGQVLLTTSKGVLLRMDPSNVNGLTLAGVEVTRITLTPKPLPASIETVSPQTIIPDPLIQVMVDQVSTDTIYEYDKGLAGEIQVWVDGEWYTITSRNTNSGTPIQKATSYVGQHMQALGLDVEYHQWGGPTYPNVIGEIPGMVNPDNIYIIGGHIDDVQYTPGGADDNASGSVAAMIAADIMSQYQWGCTLRFAFWTGEEQGLNGSYAYAQRAYQNGENILGYLNLDMIAWNTANSSPTINLIYKSGRPDTQAFAQLFGDVIGAYNLDLIPVYDVDSSGSDHYSFWEFGYNSILGIEDFADFNPYYHGSGDTSTHTDPAYFTEFVKGSLATFAHKADCLIPSGLGTLDGHVTAASGGAPIEGAKVTASDGVHSFTATSDADGYYSRLLLEGTYTVTAEAYGYEPFSVTGVEIVNDTTTTQDFSLVSLPIYTISGQVTDSVTGMPLAATIEITDAPVAPVITDPNGYYNISVAEGTWHLKVSSPMHMPQTREVVVDGNKVENFALEPLPCILLVDDDQDDPDVRAAYTSALDNLGYAYNIWDTGVQGDPGEADVSGYQQIIWFNGYPYSNTFNSDNESVIGTYLDAGGNFFFSSQDYLYEMGLTQFGQNYLHIGSFISDEDQTIVTGQNVFAGLGPYTLSYPFTNYSDIVNPGTGALIAFNGNYGSAAISYDGPSFNSVFFGYPFEAIPQLADRSAVMDTTVNFFGGCEVQPAISIVPITEPLYGAPGEQVTHLFTVTNLALEPQDITFEVTGWTWETTAPAPTGELAPGASTNVEVIVSIPAVIPESEIGNDTFTLTGQGSVGGTASADGTTIAVANLAVEVTAPEGASAMPGRTINYEFTVTNAGEYTDSYTLALEGVWDATLPGGDNTGLLAPGDSTTIIAVVQVPTDALGGDSDVTNLLVHSDLDIAITASGEVTSMALYGSLFPIIVK